MLYTILDIITFLFIIFLYTYGGWKGGSWRKVWIPIINAVYNWNWLGLLLFVPYWGYGIPTTYPVPDKGSGLGRFWYRIVNKNEFWANLFTRLTISITIAGMLFLLKCRWEVFWFIPYYILWTVVFNIEWKKKLNNPFNPEEILIAFGLGKCIVL